MVWVIIAVGTLIRLALASISRGSDDAILWEGFAKLVRDNGLLNAYRMESMLNHPPLPVLWARFALTADWAFPFVMKMPAIFADAGSCIILARLWQKRAGSSTSIFAAATYAFSPVAIMVSGYHCNNDCVYAFLSLLAAYIFAEWRQFLFGGLILGAAINVKLIPVLLIPGAVALCRSWKEFWHLVIGLSLAVIPFLPLIAVPHAVYTNMIKYAPAADKWGMQLFLWQSPNLMSSYRSMGRWLIVAAAAILSASSVRWRKWNAYELLLMIYATFLVFSPGFGVQYTVSLLPLMAAVCLGRAWLYNVLAGAFLFTVYYSYLEAFKIPLMSRFSAAGFPMPAPLFGVLAWWGLGEIVVKLIRDAMTQPRIRTGV